MKKKEVTANFIQRDLTLVLKCEWGECTHMSETMEDFIAHVRVHIRQAIEQHSTHPSDLVCQWCDCMHSIEGGPHELTRHALFHAFHIKLKSIGMNYITKGKFAMCSLDANGRNLIPDLPEQFQCGWSNCEVVSDNPEFFYEHVKGHSEDYPAGKKISVACKCLWQGCHCSFKTRYALQNHLHSHTQEKIIACPTCGNLFASHTKFKDHLERQDKSLTSFQCSHCSKCFQNERLLRDHMRKHVSNYKCPFCDMTVAAPSQLRMHIKYRHTDDREWQCKVCGKGFKTERDLNRHETSKHDNTVLSCPQAGCRFTCQHHYQLTSHITRIHEQGGQTKYVCHICGNQYQRGRTLTVHLMRHHGYRWMPGHRKFKYNRGDDGHYRLQIVRYESYELTRQMREEGGVNRSLTTPSVNANSLQQQRQKNRAGDSSRGVAAMSVEEMRATGDREIAAIENGSSGETGRIAEATRYDFGNNVSFANSDAMHGQAQAEDQEEEEEDVNSGPLDLSSPSPNRDNSAFAAIANRKNAPAVAIESDSRKTTTHLSEGGTRGGKAADTYNLQMLGDVALSSSEDNSTPRRPVTRGCNTRSKARKSLEDTINSLRNSPQKKPWHMKGNLAYNHGSTTPCSNAESTKGMATRHSSRKRTANTTKRYGIARKKIKMDDQCFTYSLGSENEVTDSDCVQDASFCSSVASTIREDHELDISLGLTNSPPMSPTQFRLVRSPNYDTDCATRDNDAINLGSSTETHGVKPVSLFANVQVTKEDGEEDVAENSDETTQNASGAVTRTLTYGGDESPLSQTNHNEQSHNIHRDIGEIIPANIDGIIVTSNKNHVISSSNCHNIAHMLPPSEGACDTDTGLLSSHDVSCDSVCGPSYSGPSNNVVQNNEPVSRPNFWCHNEGPASGPDQGYTDEGPRCGDNGIEAHNEAGRRAARATDELYEVLQMENGKLILLETNVPGSTIAVSGVSQEMPEGASVIAACDT